MELLVWHHRMNHCSFKSLLRLSKRERIVRNISKVIKLPPCISYLFVKYHKRPQRNKVKLPGTLIRKPSETSTGERI